MTARLAMEKEKRNQNDQSQTTSEEAPPGKPIIPRSVKNIAKRNFSFRSKARKQRKSPNICSPNIETYTGSYNSDNNMGIPIRNSFNNVGYRNDSDEDDDFKDFDVDSTDFEDFVRRQSTEIQELEE